MNKTNEKNDNSQGERKASNITLFNDLKLFKNKNITICFYGGTSVVGKLLSYDEIANCILEQENRKKLIVLGRSIMQIYNTNVKVHKESFKSII